MTDRELMQQTLASLEGYARNCRCEGGGGLCDAGKAIKARLAQPEYIDRRLWKFHPMTGEPLQGKDA